MIASPETFSYPVITGVGMAVPGDAISNQLLIDKTGLQSSPEWILDRTGIESRYWAEGEGICASSLAVEAGHAALLMAELDSTDIDGLYLSTTSPDYISPSTASIVHEQLKASEECASIEVRGACAGYVMNLIAASDALQIHPHQSNALVIGAELNSKRVNHQDRRTAVLFGDGAGATTLQLRSKARRPISASLTVPDKDAIYTPAGGMVKPARGFDDPETKFVMDGPAVKKHAISIMGRVTNMVATRAGLVDIQGQIDWSQIDLFVPHQANRRLIEAVGEQIGVPEEKCLITVDKYGNTSSASIPMALASAYHEGLIEPGRKRALLATVGAGMVGAAILIDIDLPN